MNTTETQKNKTTKELKKVKEFAQMENEINLFERKYSGYKYWHMLRFFCCEAAFSSRMNKDKQTKMQNKSKRNIFFYVKIICANIKTLIYYLFPKKCDILEFSISKLHNRFFTTLEFGKKTKTQLYRVDLASFEKQKFIPSLYLTLLSKIKPINQDKKEDDFFNELENEITKRFGQSFSATDMKITVINYVRKSNVYIKYFTRLLKKSKCKAILLTCYYTSTYFYLIEAAHKLNIPVIELQHGVINNHIEYWFEDTKRKYEYVPDYLLTFGNAHMQWIKLPDSEKSIAVGYPHQEQRLKELEDITTDEKMIVVYPKISNYFEKEISELADIITPKGYKVIVKMHPGEAKNYQIYYPVIAENKNIQIITDQTKDVYYWLKKGKFHVMASSTVGLEAMCFEHTNVIISLKSEHEQCQPLLDWNAAKCYQTVEELVDIILHSEKQYKIECKQLLWKNNSVENIKNTVRMIINGEKICENHI